MKSFFKSLLASIIGCGIVFFIFFLISIGMIVGLSSMGSSDTYVVKSNTVLTLNLSGILKDRVEDDPISKLFKSDDQLEMSLEKTLESIKTAKENADIKGIYIRSGAFSASSASLREIRNKLIDFKTTGKFIVAYGDIYTQGAYYLASVADEIFINPEGMLDIHGYSASPMFFKGLLDKLGVEMQIFKVGTFKSAVEPYITTKMSEPNREQVTSYLNDLWTTYTKDVAESRNITAEEINAIANEFSLLKPVAYLEQHKLVDSTLYETQVEDYLKVTLGIDPSKSVNMASIDQVSKALKVDNSTKETVAILFAEGAINSAPEKKGIIDRKVVKELEKLRKDKNVKAVVFRVNSPGGSAFASEQIWKAVTDLKAEKPIVVSMGDVAASGGYYISCNASKIYAHPNTITGSIGIFGMFPNVEGLVSKVGLNFDNVKTNKFADFGDITRPMREDEKIVMQSYVERGYDLFVKRCAEGRNMTPEAINKVGQGRVWTGNQALELGLVDALGGIEDAIQAAADLANVSNYKVVNYPAPVSFIESFLNVSKDDLATEFVKSQLGTDYNIFENIKEVKQYDYLQARMPYDVK